MTSSTLISSVVISRYARVLADLAAQEKAVSKIQKDFDMLQGMLSESQDLNDLVSSPRVSAQTQSAVMVDVLKKIKAQKLTQNFIGTLVQNRRLNILPNVMIAFEKIVSERAGEVSVCVETAVKMTAAQEKSCQDKIKKALGAKVKIEPKVTPEILGGMVVTIGSYMIDDSVRRKIERLGVALSPNSNQNIQNLKEVV